MKVLNESTFIKVSENQAYEMLETILNSYKEIDVDFVNRINPPSEFHKSTVPNKCQLLSNRKTFGVYDECVFTIHLGNAKEFFVVDTPMESQVKFLGNTFILIIKKV